MRFKEKNTCKECRQYKAHCEDSTVCNPIRRKLRNYNGIRFTSDGFDCALPVGIDSHTVCSFGCLYCFSDNLVQHRESARRNAGQTSLKKIERIFSGAEGKTNALYRKGLKYGKKKNGYPCPVQLGAITDPLDNIERNQGWFLKFVELCKKYNQPVRISTKGNLFLTDEYINALKDKPHLFRVHYSIISPDEELLPQIDLRAPPPSERIECMRRLEAIGVETCLRFRPILPGISDSTKNHPEAYKDLIDMAADAGCKNISYEVGFVPGMMTKDLRKRWKQIEKITGKPLMQIYKQFGKSQACTRSHHSWTEQIMHSIRDHAKKRGMRVGVSDPLWKQLTDSGCCCAIAEDNPVFGNWQRKNATEALYQAKKTGKLICSKDIIPDWAYNADEGLLVNPGVGPTVRYKRKYKKWADTLFETWTQLKKERSPLNYFQGALLPVKKQDGDIYFKYKGLERKKPKKTPFWNIK